ncbi:hypothetical protein [Paenibacillus sp. HGF5]|uniref:hypothetical protein n=1 Tax=Paenibacillus sp. HGF5 TaxID=908341 RepID=UPI00020727C0|nr:hypothetical protein [Paenibacillus sp. HGF5]EGG33415.1 hypothetical protein HMPREF9412_1429 [Paenibacillus sp. HGF5]
MKEKSKLHIVSEQVIDRYGNVIGDDPTQFPMLANKSKELIIYLQTGQNYKVV